MYIFILMVFTTGHRIDGSWAAEITDDKSTIDKRSIVGGNHIISLSDPGPCERRSAKLPASVMKRDTLNNSGETREDSLSMDANQPSNCMVEGRVCRHGETICSPISPCRQRMCWYGSVYDREEGCFVGDCCYAVNEVFDLDCNTFKCTKTSWSTTQTLSYSLQMLSSRCRDTQGRCRNIGDRYSDYKNGKFYEDCWCQRSWPSHTSRTVCNTDESPL